jgi:hypothetical protein
MRNKAMKNRYLRKSGFHVLPVLMLAMAVSGDVAAETPDPEKWYAEDYVPIWRKVTPNTADEATYFYHSEIRGHEPGGEVITYDAPTWLTDLVAEWVADGWTGSEVPNIQVNRINESTTSFTARYLDYYEGGATEYSCGWYLADLMDGQWKFTHYAEINCANLDFTP